MKRESEFVSRVQIAALFGVSPSTVTRRAREWKGAVSYHTRRPFPLSKGTDFGNGANAK